MTNEQKAKEIAGYKPDEKPGITMFQGQDGDKYSCYESAMAMAKYKDAHVKVVLKDMLRTYYDAPDAYPEMQRSEDEVIEAIADKLNINLDDE